MAGALEKLPKDSFRLTLTPVDDAGSDDTPVSFDVGVVEFNMDGGERANGKTKVTGRAYPHITVSKISDVYTGKLTVLYSSKTGALALTLRTYYNEGGIPQRFRAEWQAAETDAQHDELLKYHTCFITKLIETNGDANSADPMMLVADIIAERREPATAA